jgi:photosystem II stability/assembly factor-like uncharacterized protein
MDLGVSWHSTNNGLTDSNVNSITRCGAKLVAATNSGIFLSSDDGGTWVLSNQGLSNTIVNGLVIRDSTIFILTANGIFCSVDSGQSWTEIDSGLKSILQTNVLLRDGENLFAGTPSGVYLSTNEGSSWTQCNSGLTDVRIEALAIIHSTSGPILFAGTESGPFRSTDYGDSWVLVDSLFPNYPSDNPEVYSFATIDTVLFAAAGYGDFMRSTNYGTTWETLIKPFNTLILTLSSSGSTLFAGGIWNNECGVFLASDLGQSLNILDQVSSLDNSVNALGMDTDASGAIRLYIDAPGNVDGGVEESTDSGGTWEQFNAGIDSLDAESISCFATCDSFFLAGGPGGFFFSDVTRDGWTKFNSGLRDSNVHSISQIDSNLFIGTDSGVWRRSRSQMTPLPYSLLVANSDTINFGSIQVGSDALQIVTLSDTGKTALTIQSFQMTPSQDVFVTSDLSSEVTLNPGEHFTFEAYFMPTNPGVYSANLWVVSDAHIIKLLLTGTANVLDDVEQESQLTSMLAAFPNPFSQSTQITFTPPASGYAEISIFNQLGVEVARLFSGDLDAGHQHNFTFNNTAGLPDGIYECLLRMNGQTAKLPLVLLR